MKRLLNRLLGRNPTTSVVTESMQADRLIEEGHALEDAGQWAEAETRYRQAVQIAPQSARAWLNLGNAQLAQQQTDEAIASYQQALRLNPDYGPAHANLGRLFMERQDYAEAIEYYAAAVKALPDSVDAFNGLGCAFEGAKRDFEALDAYYQALAIQPDYAEVKLNVVRLLLMLGQKSLYRKNYEPAIKYYSEVLTISPNLAEAYVGLGIGLQQIGRPIEAEKAYRQALTLDSELLAAKLCMGEFLTINNQLDEAAQYLESCLAARSDYALVHAQFTLTLTMMGFIPAALDHIRQASVLDPDNPEYATMSIFTTNYLPDCKPEELFAMHLDYAQRFCSSFYPKKLSYSNNVNPERKLRLGYVSGDFRGHPASRFIELIFIHHDRAAFEIHAFYNYSLNDEITERLKGLADSWQPVVGMTDEAVAQLIQEMSIDILIDLSGHTLHNRMNVFARKSAPVQATWLGYLGTTGLQTMDYRICDSYTDPPGLTERFHTEKLARMPDSQWCHIPYVNLPPISPFPMRRKGYLTLGSFNNPAKLNEQVLILWAKVLHATPNSRLHIAATSPGRTRQRILSILGDAGIAPERIQFMPYSPYQGYLAMIAEVDIALDPFPYNGGTTSIDILMMGVPLVTLAGDRSIGRGGVSILSTVGLTELIAASPEEYVTIIQGLASDPDRLAALRHGLRERVQQSPLLDGARFTRNLETLYRQMWRTWCDQQSPNPSVCNHMPVASTDA